MTFKDIALDTESAYIKTVGRKKITRLQYLLTLADIITKDSTVTVNSISNAGMVSHKLYELARKQSNRADETKLKILAHRYSEIETMFVEGFAVHMGLWDMMKDIQVESFEQLDAWVTGAIELFRNTKLERSLFPNAKGKNMLNVFEFVQYKQNKLEIHPAMYEYSTPYTSNLADIFVLAKEADLAAATVWMSENHQDRLVSFACVLQANETKDLLETILIVKTHDNFKTSALPFPVGPTKEEDGYAYANHTCPLSNRRYKVWII